MRRLPAAKLSNMQHRCKQHCKNPQKLDAVIPLGMQRGVQFSVYFHKYISVIDFYFGIMQTCRQYALRKMLS